MPLATSRFSTPKPVQAPVYEAALVAQARRIASGESSTQPNPEHLRVLLRWLDGHASCPVQAVTH